MAGHPTSNSWAEAYARVQSTLLLERNVHNATVYPHWIDDSRAFWYGRISADGSEVRIVDAATGEGCVAFTFKTVATALGRALDAEVDPEIVILGSLEVTSDPPRARFRYAYDRSWTYDYVSGILAETIKTNDRNWLVSPDGRLAAILRDHNLWIREIDTGKERALTTDGTDVYAYADTPASTRVLRCPIRRSG